MKKICIAIFLFCLANIHVGYSYAQQMPTSQQHQFSDEAQVLRIVSNTYIIPNGGTERIHAQIVELQMRSDQKVVEVDTGKLPLSTIPQYKVGDEVVIQRITFTDNTEQVLITDYVRRRSLLWLFALFCVVAVGIGRWQGLASLFGMLMSFGVIFGFMLPQLLLGRDPVGIAILSSAAIVPLTFCLSHGLNKKTLISIVGTLLSLGITGILAQFFMSASMLSGSSSEESGLLQAFFPGSVNMRGLLLAGIIIGGLGIFDDITISQASIVAELRSAGKRSMKDLYLHAMRVGHDHIASMINTLVLVYAGASLPLLMIFVGSSRPFTEIVNFEFIAEEIVRTLVGSIGLMIAVPLTTVVAAYVFSREKDVSRKG